MLRFSVAGGSVAGFDHTKPGQPGSTNNQDAYAWRISESSLVAIICDGCGSAPHSEVGAHMCAQTAVGVLSQLLSARDSVSAQKASDLLGVFQTQVLANIASWARAMAGAKSFEDIVQEYFFCTIIGVAIVGDTTMIFSQGDGVFSVNENTVIIPRYENNAPPYLGHALVPGQFRNRSLLQCVARAIVPTEDVRSVLIGSDGVGDLIEAEEKYLPGKPEALGPLSQFWTTPRYRDNPDAIRRRLVLANLDTVVIDEAAAAQGIVRGRIKPGLLHDDTTVVVVRREPEQEE